MHSIRSKIIAVTIAAILSCILLLGGIGILNITKESDRSSVEKMGLVCENLKQTLNAYLSSLEQSVEMAVHLARDSLTDLDLDLFSPSLTEEEQHRLDTVLTDHCGTVEEAFASIANHTSGVITYYYCVNSDLGSSQHGFFWSRKDTAGFVEQPPLISTDLDPKDTEHTTWYYSPIKNGTAVWVGPYLAHYLDEAPVVSYVAPVYKYGFLVGVLGMDILFETMTEQVSSLKIYDTGFAFLMDRDGTILYHPSYAFGAYPEVLGEKIGEEITQRLSNRNELLRYTSGGEERQLAFETLRNKTKLGITVPVSEITSSQRQVSLIILVATLALVVVFGLLTLLVMNAITRPLLNLAAASERLMNGDYDTDLDYNGQDEVGTLTRSFRQMRDHMKLYINDLNSRVYVDAMTGVKNKGAFDLSVSALNRDIQEKETTRFAFVMLDCNNLKQINDAYGHERGDIYLKTACALICHVFDHSPVYRTGGDEFCVLLQDSDYDHRDELIVTFDYMAQETNRQAWNPWEQIDIARGLGVYDPIHDHSAEEVLQRADQKMYENKKDTKRS